MIVAEDSFFPSPVARRYGGALFELAQEQGCIDSVEKELIFFVNQIEAHTDLRRLILSPLLAAKDQQAVIRALIDKISVQHTGTDGALDLVGNFLQTIAINRRLSHLFAMVQVFQQLKAQARGEMVANVSSAYELTAAQQQQLKQQLDEISGKNVTLRMRVVPALLGGLVVRLGSRLLDTSLSSKLSSLKMHLKEVG